MSGGSNSIANFALRSHFPSRLHDYSVLIIIQENYTFSCLEATTQLGAQSWHVELSIILIERKREQWVSHRFSWKIKFCKTVNKLPQGLYIDGLKSVFATSGPYAWKWENAISQIHTHDDRLEREINYTHNSLDLIFGGMVRLNTWSKAKTCPHIPHNKVNPFIFVKDINFMAWLGTITLTSPLRKEFPLD